MNAAERVRRRISELLAERGWTQSALAQSLGKTSPWLSQLLAGKLNLGLDELDRMALALGSTAVELVRDPEQFQFCADLTPSEMAMLRRFRKLGPSVREAVQTLVQAVDTPATRPGIGAPRYVGPTPSSPTELSDFTQAFAKQLIDYVAADQAESRRQTAASRPTLATASGGGRSRRRRVPKVSR